MKSLTDCHRRLAYLSGVILLALTVLPLCAAEHSPTLDYVLANTPSDEPVSVLLFLDHRLTMDDVYSAARNLPMQERRQYVVNVLQRRFSEMSPGVMEDLELAAKSGTVTLLRPLWILNAIRVSAIPEVIRDVDRNHSEVIYIATDAVYEDALDWGVAEIGAPQVWEEYGADGSGVVVGHKDAGLDWDHPGFDGHIWVNPGEDLNHNGHIDEPDEVNNIDDDSNGYVDDFRGWNFDYHNNDVSDDPQGGGHGTKTGSVISASNSTVCGQISVAPGAKLMVLRGVWTQGAFYEASQYAIAMNANVISSSASYKLSTCDYVLYRDCPNFVAHRWVCEMELAAGIIHANSVGNEGLANPVPLSVAAPANCPPPAMTAGHEQQGGVSSVVGVAAYFQNGSYYSSSGHGPSGWSEEDICAHPRMPYCGPDGSSSEYPAEFEDYPYHDSEFPGLAKPDITAPTIVPSLDRGGGCDNINATSGAAPHVGGALALIYSAFPGITPEDAYFVLMNGVVDAGEAGYDSLWGFGKLRIFRACSLAVDLRAIVAGHVEDPLDNPVTDVRVSAEGTSVALTDEGGD